VKPIIAIVTLYDEKLESYWMLPGYAQGLEEAGAAPVVLPLTSDPAALERYAHTFDGFLFPGGHDLAPSLYGEEPSEKCGTVIPQRDSMEQAFFPLALATRKPLLGICRGIQLMNVALGGDLYQDIKPFEHVPHNDHWGKIHTVTVRRDTLLSRILGQDTVLVNSQHHQAVDKVAPGLVLSALSEDGIVEGIEKPDAKFCLGVQWHPEWLSAADPAMQGIFDAFVAACK
jgi:putative glutamine amidotransferase